MRFSDPGVPPAQPQLVTERRPACVQQHLWRSLLFVPANVERYIDRAPSTGADVVILDLEDSVLASAKQAARECVEDAARALDGAALPVFVRVNRPLRLLLKDLEDIVGPHVAGVVLPKADSPGLIEVVDDLLTTLEEERSLAPGHTKLYPLIETARGLESVNDVLVASPRVVAATAGLGDLAFSSGFDLRGLAVHSAFLRVVTAALAADVLPLGLAELGDEFEDLVGFRRLAEFSKGLGSLGSPCIHPRQVDVLNEVFQPSPREIEWAHSVVSTFEQQTEAAGDGRGALVLDGSFIDVAMSRRAQAILASAAAVERATAPRPANRASSGDPEAPGQLSDRSP